MRIASLVPQNHVGAVYRSLIPMQALAHRGHAVHVEERDDVPPVEALREFDVVHVWRSSHEAMRRVARRLKERGVALVWDNDVDAATLPPDHPEHALATGIRGQAFATQLTAMMRLADIVTAPSAPLAERFQRASGADVRVLANQLPPTFARPERVMPHNGVTVGWVAAQDHHRDFEQAGVRDALERLLARHHHIELIGVGLDVAINSHRYRHVPAEFYGRLPEQLAHFDVALAPLVDIPYNEVRSDVKLKEYAAVGVPWLASPIGPYAAMGEDEGGRLVADGDWYREIEQLVLDPDARSRLARRGRLWAEGETIERHVETWEATFAEAIERAHAAHAVR